MGIRRARNAARRLRDDLGVPSTPPVNVHRIANALGVDIVERHNLDVLGHQNVSGLLLRRKGRTICLINAGDGENRKRFSIAHEIGHLVLHPFQEQYVDPKFSLAARDQKSTEGVDLFEIEANAFAAELLMPEDWLRRQIDRPLELDVFSDARVSELASQYKVSLQAMTIRLTSLKLLNG